MLSVTTTPQGFIAFLLMLLNTGTQLTWHCGQRHLVHQHGTNRDVDTVAGRTCRYLEAEAYGGHGVENRRPGGGTVTNIH